MGKQNKVRRGASSEMNKSTADSGLVDASRPWWMPDDLDKRAVRVSKDMIEGLPDKAFFELKHLDGVGISLRRKKALVENVLFSIMSSPDYRMELARWALLKPLEVAKIHASMIPKNVTVDGNVKHQHVIVVPVLADAQVWNDAHQHRKDLGEGDWGTELSDTPFIEYSEPGGVQ